MSWVSDILEPVVQVSNSYFSSEQKKAEAQIQAGINNSTVNTQPSTDNGKMIKTTLYVIGGTIGLLLTFSLVKGIMK